MIETPVEVKDFNSMTNVPASKEDILQCKKCMQQSKLSNWLLVEDAVYCEICGEHDGLKCPTCGYIHDYIFPQINLIVKMHE